ncbi:hypothetical protein A2W24_00250 [Microgenomates group bacterium RBG_16_45_19]|nr:MAG: hypothetical protein A2W24_00250 [Microgenomates group bacterium RBG_16_45_19]
MPGDAFKSFIIDASWVLSYLVTDEITSKLVVSKTNRILNNPNLTMTAPAILPFEVGNGLRMGWARQRLSIEDVGRYSQEYGELPIKLSEIDFGESMTLAMENKLTFYDAAYVWLAVEKKAELLTLDEKMKRVWQKLRES